MATLPAGCDTQASTLAEVVFHPDLSATQVRVLLARMLEPDTPVAELARKLDVDRSTATRALARARRLGVVHQCIASDQEVCSSAPGGGAAVHQGGAPAHLARTPPEAGADLPERKGQPQGRPPAPPRATPPRAQRATEPQQSQLVEDPARQVIANRKAAGLATGVNPRAVARVLADLAAEGHPLDAVIDAASRARVVTTPSVVMTMNEGTGARKRPSQAARPWSDLSPEDRAEIDAFDPEEARRRIASWG